ncbi:MAG: VacB/RNase II family 3'-5' exoribonuclease [Candidatus Cloacimonetes bacterium]|nr:VacB/RNase II family 3'-5' exoribonuclease [Candidatus Cloacimonadota bacterium]
MRRDIIERKVKKLLEESKHKNYKLRDIENNLKIGKHNRKDLISVLRNMKEANSIHYKYKKYSQPIKNKLIQGIFDARPLVRDKSFAFVICDDFDVFVDAENINNAFDKDVVLVDVKVNQRGKRYGEIQEIVTRNTTKFTGVVQKYRDKYLLIQDSLKIHKNFVINKLNNAKVNEKVVVEVTNWGNIKLGKLPGCSVKEVLGIAGNPQVEVLSVIKQFDLPLEFSDEIYAELKYLNDNISDEEINKRKDLRELTTFTIDPESAKDFDDAISLEKIDDKWKIYVHIADVAHYVKAGSIIFKETLKRGNSYYLPKKVIPMLPEAISNKLCSLRPFEEKLTLTVETLFSNDFRIMKQRVYESVIRSDQRFNYKEIDDFFAGNSENFDENLGNILNDMKVISAKLSEKRIKEGYIFFNLPDNQFIYDDEGKLVDIVREEETASHKLIENFMLLANEYVAKTLSNSTTIYRIHGKPDELEMMELQKLAKFYNIEFKKNDNPNTQLQNILLNMDEKYHRIFDKIFLRKMKKAQYSIVNIGHFGLGLQNYTHFTSPIRRLCDLIVHHQLKFKIRHKREIFGKKKLADFAKISSKKELIANEAEREIEIRFKLQFMKQFVSEDFLGVVSGMNSSSLFVELDKFPASGLISLTEKRNMHYDFNRKSMTLVCKNTKKTYRLADAIKVRIISVSDDIYLQEI